MSTFRALIEGQYGSDQANVTVVHHSDRDEKRRAEVAVLLAAFIVYARAEYGFTAEEISGWGR